MLYGFIQKLYWKIDDLIFKPTQNVNETYLALKEFSHLIKMSVGYQY